MSHKFERSKKRLAKFEARFAALRNRNVPGTHAVEETNEQIEQLFRDIEKSPEELMLFVERVMGPKPEGREAAEEWERVMVMAQQIVAPRLAAMTPGNVYARGIFLPPGRAKRSS